MTERLGQVVTLAIGEDLFAVPVTRVMEILDQRRIARLPQAPRHLLGVIDVRGDGVAVVDLRALLGCEVIGDIDSSRILVLWVQTPERRAVIGLRADRVIEVTMLDDGVIAPLAEAKMLNWDERLVAGIGRRNGDFVTVLDLDRMFDGATLAQADGMGRAAGLPQKSVA
ncbi:chemotaxis protein CheW [Phaeovulum sp. W22_SRMD_FR3]|uniref:chemotaxis protein CheW n=1 Tax=Phaeovulum sp. W22_SRMD_FR3 TaxID=3240274 RepID=UPI003F9C15CA